MGKTKGKIIRKKKEIKLYFLNYLENLGSDYELIMDETPLECKSNSNSCNLFFFYLSFVYRQMKQELSKTADQAELLSENRSGTSHLLTRRLKPAGSFVMN